MRILFLCFFFNPSLKGCQRKRVFCSVQVTKGSCYAAEPKIKAGDSAVLLKLRLKQGSVNLFLARGQHCPTSPFREWQGVIKSITVPFYPQGAQLSFCLIAYSQVKPTDAFANLVEWGPKEGPTASDVWIFSAQLCSPLWGTLVGPVLPETESLETW